MSSIRRISHRTARGLRSPDNIQGGITPIVGIVDLTAYGHQKVLIRGKVPFTSLRKEQEALQELLVAIQEEQL